MLLPLLSTFIISFRLPKHVLSLLRDFLIKMIAEHIFGKTFVLVSCSIQSHWIHILDSSIILEIFSQKILRFRAIPEWSSTISCWVSRKCFCLLFEWKLVKMNCCLIYFNRTFKSIVILLLQVTSGGNLYKISTVFGALPSLMAWVTPSYSFRSSWALPFSPSIQSQISSTLSLFRRCFGDTGAVKSNHHPLSSALPCINRHSNPISYRSE